MTKVFFSLLFLLLHQLVLAQDEVIWGKLAKSKGTIGAVLPIIETDFFSIRYQGGALSQSVYLAKHSEFEMAFIKKIKMNVERSITTFQEVRIINSEAYVLMTDKVMGKHILFAQKYNYECERVGEAIELASYDLPKGLWKTNSYFGVIQSQNKEYFCVTFDIPGKRDNADRFGYKIFNKFFEVQNEGEYESPFDGNESDFSNHFLSNKGDYFLANKVYNSNDKGRIRDYSSLEKVVILQLDNGSSDEFEIDIDDRRITDMDFSSDNEKILTFTGLYGDNLNAAKGVFYFRLDFENKEILDEGFEKFDKDFITLGWSDKEIDRAERLELRGKGEPELYNYTLRDIVTLSDGSIIGLIEQYYIQTISTTDASGRIRSTNYFYYNDIITYKVLPNGTFDWLRKIPKSQVSLNDDGYLSSISRYYTQDKMVLFFNDNLRNYTENGQFNGEVSTTSYRKKLSCVARVELDLTTGEVSRNVFLSGADAEAIAIPKKFVNDPVNQQMLMVFQIGRKERFGIIKYGTHLGK